MRLDAKARMLRGLRIRALMQSRREAGLSYVEPVRAWAVLVALLLAADDDGASWPSLATIAAETQLPVRTVQAVLCVLQDAGMVVVEHRQHVPGRRCTTNRYQLRLGELAGLCGAGMRDELQQAARAAAAPEHAQPLRQSTRSRCTNHAQPLRMAGAAAAPEHLEDGIVQRTDKRTGDGGRGSGEQVPGAAELVQAYPQVAGAVFLLDVAAAGAAIMREAETPDGATTTEILAAVRALRGFTAASLSWPRRYFQGRGYWPAVLAARAASARRTTGELLRAEATAAKAAELESFRRLDAIPDEQRSALLAAAVDALQRTTGRRLPIHARAVKLEAVAILDRGREAEAVA